MKRSHFYLLSISLAASVSLNMALYFWGDYWKNAWVNQFITTSDVEKILIEAGDNLSFNNIKSVSDKLSYGSVIEVEAKGEYYAIGADPKALKINDTILFFKEGLYSGSKSLR